jgi:hypothetical protein
VFEMYKSTVIALAVGMLIMFIWLLNESLPSSIKFIKPAETAFVRKTPTTNLTKGEFFASATARAKTKSVREGKPTYTLLVEPTEIVPTGTSVQDEQPTFTLLVEPTEVVLTGTAITEESMKALDDLPWPKYMFRDIDRIIATAAAISRNLPTTTRTPTSP